MDEFLARLKQRKIVQWAVAYVAGTWVVLQVLSLVSDSYHWPDAVMHVAFGVLAVGFVVVLVLAWYHGERGLQRVGSMEIMILAVLLAIGGGLIWHFARTPSTPGAASRIAMATTPPAASVKARHAPAAMTRAVAARSTSIAAPATSPVAVPSIPAKSVAVLPFENLSTDKGNAYFADGIQDLILTKLADIGDLKVISRTSTESYGSHPGNLKQIGQQLGVATILEGSVQKAGNQVLINVQLIDARTDAHIWAESYTRTLTNIFGVEGEVAGKVAAALNAKLTQSESARVTAVPTHDPKAYNEYLRATHYANEARKGGYLTFLPKAIAAYQQAVKQDPQFALAWAGLSKTRSEARYWGVDTSQHNLREAAAAAARALSLAPDLPEAHVAMGAVARFLYHDLEAAHAQYEQAVRLRPNSPGALDKLAINDGNRGQMAASFRTYRRLIALEPEQSSPVMGLGLFQMVAGDYDAARGTLASALAINPNGAESWALLSRIDVLQNGDVNAAVRVLDRMPPGTPRNLHVAIQRIRLLLYRRDFAGAGQLAAKFATQFDSGSGPVTIAIHRANGAWLAGDKPAAHRFYRELIALLASPKYDVNGTDHADLGVAYARLGNADRAVQEIETGVKIMRHAHYANISYFDVAMAKVQLAFGHKTQAINALRKALTQQNHGLWLSPALLQLDPTWDPIRHDPRFQALLKKYGQSAPATATSVLPVPATSEANHG